MGKCGCCGQEGSNKTGCSCTGGKSHDCLNLASASKKKKDPARAPASPPPARREVPAPAPAPKPAAATRRVAPPRPARMFDGYEPGEWRTTLVPFVREPNLEGIRPRATCAYTLRPLQAGSTDREHIFECQAMAQAVRDCSEFATVLRQVDHDFDKLGDQPTVVQRAFEHIRETHNHADINLTLSTTSANLKKRGAFSTVLNRFTKGKLAESGLYGELVRNFDNDPELDQDGADAAAERVMKMLDGIEYKLVDRLRDPRDARQADRYNALADDVVVMFDRFRAEE